MSHPLAAVIFLTALSPQGDDQVDKAIKEFKKSYRNPSTFARSGAVGKLGKIQHERTLKILIPLLSKDESQVRTKAAHALLGFTDHREKVLKAYVQALRRNEGKNGALPAIIENIGKLGDASGLKGIHRYLRHKDLALVKVTVRAVERIKEKESVGPLIEALEDFEKRQKSASGTGVTIEVPRVRVRTPSSTSYADKLKAVIAEVHKVLRSLTGENLRTAQEWKGWWRGARGSFLKK